MQIRKIALALLLGGLIINSVQANYDHYKSDKGIKKTMDEVIDSHPNLDDDVSFSVKDGCVTLTGKVDNMSEKQKAAEIASSISGVREVNNRLKIK